MSFKKVVAAFVFLASISTVLIAILGTVSISQLPLPFTEQGPIHSLTGLDGIDAPVLVVKIDDTTYAHPQVGLKSADVIYIEQVEGGLTRLAAFFSSKIPPLVGPVRSARISDLELLSQYGKVGFAYSGAQRLLLPEIAAANLYDVGANKFGPNFYFNEPTRNAPYAMMVKAPEVLAEANERGMVLANSKNMGWNIGEPSPERIMIKSARISWPASSYDATWSTSEKRWLLSHNGNLNRDSDGYILGPQTLVVQLVSITDSIYKDKVGGVTPFSATVGEGVCYLLRDGGYLPCKWSRPSEESGTTFTDLNGAEATFEKGQIWFALTSQEPVFASSQVQDATTSTRK